MIKTKTFPAALILSFLMLTFFSCQQPKVETGPEEANKKLIRDYYEQVVNTRNQDLLGDYIADDIVFHRVDHKGDRNGLTDFTDFFLLNTESFDNMKHNIMDVMAENDKVTVVFNTTAVYKKNNNNIDIHGIRIYRINNGKIAEIWEAMDDVLMLRQAGLLDTLDYPYRASQDN